MSKQRASAASNALQYKENGFAQFSLEAIRVIGARVATRNVGSIDRHRRLSGSTARKACAASKTQQHDLRPRRQTPS
jgi:hypothetical protein